MDRMSLFGKKERDEMLAKTAHTVAIRVMDIANLANIISQLHDIHGEYVLVSDIVDGVNETIDNAFLHIALTSGIVKHDLIQLVLHTAERLDESAAKSGKKTDMYNVVRDYLSPDVEAHIIEMFVDEE